MRLNNRLVTSFYFGEIEYEIDLTFDNVLDAFEILEYSTLRDFEKVDICLALLVGDENGEYECDDPIELWNHIYTEFIQTKHEEPIQYDRKGNPVPVVKDDEDDKQLYDIVQDAEYIYSSFQQAYGMNLFDVQGKLQWSEFRALLNGLPSETILQRIIQIRAWKPSKGDSSEYKENMRKLQKVYALYDSEEVD